MGMKPLKDRILVRQAKPEEKSVGGIILPQGKERYDDKGTVEAVGPDVKDVKVGDVIIFTRRPASHLGESNPEWNGLLMLKEEDACAIIETT